MARGVKIVAVLAAGLMLLAACESDDDEAQEDPTEEVDPETDAGDDRDGDERNGDEGDDGGEGDEETVAVVEAALMVEGDLPEGFTGEPADPEESNRIFAAAEGIDACDSFTEFGERIDDAVVSADSADFADAAGNLAANEVEVFADTDEAASALDLLVETDPEACLAEAVRVVAAEDEDRPEGSEVGAATADASPTLTVDQPSTGFRLTVPLTIGGATIDVVVELYAVQVGPAIVRYTFLGVGAPVAGAEAAVEASVSRAEQFV